MGFAEEFKLVLFGLFLKPEALFLFLPPCTRPIRIYEFAVPQPGFFVFVGRHDFSPLFVERVVVTICRSQNYRYVFS